MIRVLFFVGLILALPLPVGAADTAAVKKDLAQLQGDWVLVSAVMEGQPLPDQIRKKMRWVCRGNEVTRLMAGKVVMQGKITIDPARKPKTMDLHSTEGIIKGITQFGIYEISGDTFKYCFVTGSAARRPRDFTCKTGDGRGLMVWKRVQQPVVSPKQK